MLKHFTTSINETTHYSASNSSSRRRVPVAATWVGPRLEREEQDKGLNPTREGPRSPAPGWANCRPRRGRPGSGRGWRSRCLQSPSHPCQRSNLSSSNLRRPGAELWAVIHQSPRSTPTSHPLPASEDQARLPGGGARERKKGKERGSHFNLAQWTTRPNRAEVTHFQGAPAQK